MDRKIDSIINKLEEMQEDLRELANDDSIYLRERLIDIKDQVEELMFTIEELEVGNS